MEVFDHLVLSGDFEALGKMHTMDGAGPEKFPRLIRSVYEYYGPCERSDLYHITGAFYREDLYTFTRRACAKGELQEKILWVRDSGDGAYQIGKYALVNMYDPELIRFVNESAGNPLHR